MNKQKDLELIKFLEAMVGTKVWYQHFHLDNGYMTVACTYGDTLKIGASFCSPNDNFDRLKGRKIALRRLASKKHSYDLDQCYFDPTSLESPFNICCRCAKVFIENSNSLEDKRIPNWVQNKKLVPR